MIKLTIQQRYLWKKKKLIAKKLEQHPSDQRECKHQQGRQTIMMRKKQLKTLILIVIMRLLNYQLMSNQIQKSNGFRL